MSPVRLAALVLAVPLFVAANCDPPANDPTQSCWGQPVPLGYRCCDDGYPGSCPEDERCVAPDSCGAPIPSNDEPMMTARPARKRSGL
jgi:hypothetical protein